MFPATLGQSERMRTIGAVAVGVVIMSIVGIAFAVQSGSPYWLFVSLPFTLVLLVVGRFAPSAYRLGPQGVEVERRAGVRRIAYRDITAVDREPRAVNGMTMLGSKGVFGRFGRFWSPGHGAFTLYLANTRDIVWLHTAGGLVGLSPDRPDEFVERLRSRVAVVR
ncbi:MAG: PH domain-containing protein [Candidatus Rokuibacteriota bacterium]